MPNQRIESILTVAAGAEAVLNLCNEVLGEGDASVASPVKQANQPVGRRPMRANSKMIIPPITEYVLLKCRY